ncbi:hypothetical protein SNOG_11910 [Parastagonospora nodorum SN15]|uniref:Uncharacterized protein n=1 Tax=Phaeosphaeria nodorum (strain SN15 / ATCC MYA-4574 / FGSC 10173) TaxID=321614 RepID=Q0U8K4_PHANO|nr:hypothetical protein SNOG_11910 [Parastagonospora nodorum SN15]EAT80954.1 hypothetical protein SNOG_11910 [Parastagonospora nodorum SN15]
MFRKHAVPRTSHALDCCDLGMTPPSSTFPPLLAG